MRFGSFIRRRLLARRANAKKRCCAAPRSSGSMSLSLISSWQARRRFIGWVRRKTQWEFWPPWIAYIPLLPYFLYLGLKYRSLTLFTAANPGIPSGGFVGESKCRILANLSGVPVFRFIAFSLPADARFNAANAFLA